MENDNEYSDAINETFIGTKLSARDISILYSVMVKRISKGYTAWEISFLSGYSFDYFGQKECLIDVGFDMADMQLFCMAIGDESLAGLIQFDFNQEERQDYKMVRTTHFEIIVHELYRITDNDMDELIFKLFEDNRDYTDMTYYNTVVRSIKEAQVLLNMFFEGDYFYSPRSPLSIYAKMRAVSQIHPEHLQSALLELTKKKGFPRLKLKKSSIYGCTYEKLVSKEETSK